MEVISVMVVMVLVLTVAVGAHVVWKRQNALDAVEMQVSAHLALARQNAITQARPTTFTATNQKPSNTVPGVLSLTADLTLPASPECGWFFVSTATTNTATDAEQDTLEPNRTLVSDTVRLPRRLLWCQPDPGAVGAVRALADEALHITFLPDGSCAGSEDLWASGFRDLSVFQDLSPNARTNLLLRRTLRISRLTGLARTLRRDEDVQP